MKIWLLFWLSFASFHVLAASWYKVGFNEHGDIFYVDIDNIEKEQETVYYRNLINFTQRVSQNARSHISTYKVDCGKNKQTWMDYQYYSEHMGKGKKVTGLLPVWNHYGSTLNEIRSLEPESVEYEVMKTACSFLEKNKKIR